MKSSFKKISAALAALMVVSMMVPVLAFASAWFKDVVFRSSTVTGLVYADENIGDTVTINVYDENGNFITSFDSDRVSVRDDVYNYSFRNSSVNSSTYNPIILSALDGTVTETVYASRSSGGGGGGGSSRGITRVSAGLLTNQFANGNVATITIRGTQASLPVSALLNAPEGAIVIIKNSTGSIALPVSVFDFDALAEELDVTTATMNILVTIAKLSGNDATAYAEALEAVGGTSEGDAVDFSVEATAGNKTVSIGDFGDTYVERTIANASVEGNVTAVRYDAAEEEFFFIPMSDEDGVATLKSTTNSIYSVVSFDNSFADVASHWSKSYVESMANKLLAEGYEDGTFGPDRSITRAEFATLVTRALGLEGKSAPSASFSDVRSSDWFADAVALAADAGIVNGYEDGTFQPNKVITREELAAMVVRASAYAGTELSGNTSALSSFSDANDIVWADEEVAAAVSAGIVEGFEDGTFGPVKTATRAEASTMLQRFLANADFIVE